MNKPILFQFPRQLGELFGGTCIDISTVVAIYICDEAPSALAKAHKMEYSIHVKMQDGTIYKVYAKTIDEVNALQERTIQAMKEAIKNG